MNVVLSPVSVPDLVAQIAAEVVSRIQSNEQPAQTAPVLDPIRLFGDKAAAKYLGCSVMTVQNLRKSGRISFYRTGRKVYYVTTELDSALQFTPRKFQKR